MTDHVFCIDSLDVVHFRYCGLVMQPATPYGSLAKTQDAMIEALERPDIKDRRSAPSPLIGCDQCIHGRAIDDV